jgi:hypothetical protein
VLLDDVVFWERMVLTSASSTRGTLPHPAGPPSLSTSSSGLAGSPPGLPSDSSSSTTLHSSGVGRWKVGKGDLPNCLSMASFFLIAGESFALVLVSGFPAELASSLAGVEVKEGRSGLVGGGDGFEVRWDAPARVLDLLIPVTMALTMPRRVAGVEGVVWEQDECAQSRPSRLQNY